MPVVSACVHFLSFLMEMPNVRRSEATRAMLLSSTYCCPPLLETGPRTGHRLFGSGSQLLPLPIWGPLSLRLEEPSHRGV